MNTEQTESHATDLLSFDEAVKFLDTSKSTLYRLLSQNEVKGVKVGKQWRFRKADLTAYIERSPVAVSVDVAAHADIQAENEFLAGEILAAGQDPVGLEEGAPETKVAAIANRILQLAILSNASDVHLEPTDKGLRLRYRIDGVLHDIRRIPNSLHESVIAALKEMSDMNVIEKRLPQDGRALLNNDQKEYDVRMSLMPTIQGESMVMRIIDRSSTLMGLEKLGFSSQQLDFLRSCAHRPNGLILVTGPTGSGKTTVLYSCLLEIDLSGAKVLTVEDPVECRIQEVVQVQVNRRNGLTFAAAMRSMLRSDPDVLLCGELPDLESVDIALRAALTGQVVLTCLHAEDSLAAITRLVDIGVERYLITSSLTAVVATRRIRKLCQNCKAIADDAGLVARIRPVAERGGYRSPEDAIFYTAVGCEQCRGTGFQGRANLYEVLPCNPKLITRLIQAESIRDMLQIAVEAGMRTLLADGVRRAVAGETSLQEVVRVTDAGL